MTCKLYILLPPLLFFTFAITLHKNRFTPTCSFNFETFQAETEVTENCKILKGH